MKMIISPAKKMRVDRDFLPPKTCPAFLPRAQRLADYLKGLSLPELGKLLACSGDIAAANYKRYQSMDLSRAAREGTPALLAYDGIQYQYMAPQVMEEQCYSYLESHLRILSGLYGLLRPFDGVTPYRLEMQAKLKTPFCRDLYDYWGGLLAQCLAEEDSLILDLASREYSRAVAKHLPASVRMVSCVFGEFAGGKVVEKGVYVKMARGEMVRYLAETGGENLEAVRAFDRMGYRLREELSREDRLVFVKEE